LSEYTDSRVPVRFLFQAPEIGVVGRKAIKLETYAVGCSIGGHLLHGLSPAPARKVCRHDHDEQGCMPKMPLVDVQHRNARVGPQRRSDLASEPILALDTHFPISGDADLNGLDNGVSVQGWSDAPDERLEGLQVFWMPIKRDPFWIMICDVENLGDSFAIHPRRCKLCGNDSDN